MDPPTNAAQAARTSRGAAVRPASATPRVGDRLLDRYALRAELGRGSMGRVYHAHDELLGRDVAIKVLAHAAEGGADAAFREAVAREARAAARLVHPGIATLFDIGEQDGHAFLVMELVEGHSLREVLETEGTLLPARAVEIAIQVADALSCAHDEGLVHCDVKPLNVVVADDGTAKLVDFGVACAATTTGAFSRDELYGSLPYLAPEQVLGERPDARTDVYALGAVLYEMLAGRPPFDDPDATTLLRRRLAEDPPALGSQTRAVTPELEQVVMRALSRDPAGRHAMAGELRDELRALLPTLSVARQDTVRIDPRLVEGSVRRVARRGPAAPAARHAAPSQRANWLPGGKWALGALLIVAVAIVLAGGLMLATALGGFGQPGERWAQFTKRSCEWSNTTTPPAICFGERDPGYRVRIVSQEGNRWLVWDPATKNVAYVEADALREE
jgi:eukaryotic-like serine/threonine-protein kinase